MRNQTITVTERHRIFGIAITRIALTFCFVTAVHLYFDASSLALAAPTFIREADNKVTTGTTASVALPSTAPGNLIVVYVVWDNASTARVSDNFGSSFASAGGPTRWSSSYSA